MTPPDVFPILSSREARAFEEQVLGADEGRTRQAMAMAGEALASAITRDLEWRGRRLWATPRILVLAGKGHNTGDACLAAKHLLERAGGGTLTVLRCLDGEWRPLAQAAIEACQGLAGVEVRLVDLATSAAVLGQDYDLCLDGIVGQAFQGELPREVADLLKRVNEAGHRLGFRVAIDLPTGVSDTAAVVAFDADVTYATGIPKAGLFEPSHQRWVGRIRFLDLGFFRQSQPPTDAYLVGTEILRQLTELRPAASDKRTFGQVLALGGSLPMPGAIHMAMAGALRAGAGLVTAFVPAPVQPLIAPTLPEVMWRPLLVKPDGGLADDFSRVVRTAAERAQVLLIGPGLTLDRTTVFQLARIIREIALPMVLDAGALSPDIVSSVLARPETAGPVVITPHQGEFNRLLNRDSGGYDRREFLGYCRQNRVVGLLKGPVTRVTDGDQLYCVTAGGPVLARGGSGDILAGMLAALLARYPTDPLRATLLAAAWQGAAADRLTRLHGEVAVRTTDILDHLGPTLREI